MKEFFSNPLKGADKEPRPPKTSLEQDLSADLMSATYECRTTEGMLICTIEVGYEVKKITSESTKESEAAGRRLRRLVLKGTKNGKLTQFDVLSLLSHMSKEKSPLGQEFTAVISSDEKALPEFYPDKNRAVIPTPNTLERLIITLHEFGHAAQQEDPFFAKRAPASINESELPPLERAARVVMGEPWFGKSLPTKTREFLKDIGTLFSKIRELRSLQVLSLGILVRPKFNSILKTVLAGSAEAIPTAGLRKALEREGFILHPKGTQGEDGIDEEMLLQLWREPTALSVLTRSYSLPTLKIMPVGKLGVVLRLPILIAPEETNQSPQTKFVDLAVTATPDTAHLFNSVAKDQEQINANERSLAKLRVLLEKSPAKVLQHVHILGEVEKITERDAWKRALIWMRELRRDYGIDLLQDNDALNNARTFANKCLSTYGATTRQLIKEYQRIPSPQRMARNPFSVKK